MMELFRINSSLGDVRQATNTPLLRDHLQISQHILSEFKQINLHFPRNHPKIIAFSDDFKGEQKLINSLKLV